ncbi:hypothetical protein PUN28_007835 [Cardiocondyla obscurior]|uniref:Uncharacterized protein n=1 Tax=Cardiocondyla obscurior TaxID=286306 RepID=A0AAW2FWS2_9HYME
MRDGRRSRRMREIRERKKGIDGKVNQRKKNRTRMKSARASERARERQREIRRRPIGRRGEPTARRTSKPREEKAARRLWWGGTDWGGARHAEGPASGTSRGEGCGGESRYPGSENRTFDGERSLGIAAEEEEGRGGR